MRFQRELLKGTTETLILAVLRNAPSHGYELVGRLRQRSEGIFELGEGTLPRTPELTDLRQLAETKPEVELTTRRGDIIEVAVANPRCRSNSPLTAGRGWRILY